MKYERPLVPRPCHEDWDKLTPADRGHFCTVCETKVWDLSALSSDEASAFLREAQGEVCVSYKERAGGEVVHRENVVPLARLVRRLPVAAGFSLALAACTPSAQAPQPESSDKAPASEPSTLAEPVAKPVPVPVPATKVEPPEVAPDPAERHVKGKWAPEDKPEVEPEPVTKKGKFARPD